MKKETVNCTRCGNEVKPIYRCNICNTNSYPPTPTTSGMTAKEYYESLYYNEIVEIGKKKGEFSHNFAEAYAKYRLTTK